MSQDTKSGKEFELVFEGLEDTSPQALQKVKAVLVGDMEIPVPDVQNILENYPLTIKRSEREDQLNIYFRSLKSAGAKVLLLKPKEEESALSLDDDEIEFEIEIAPKKKSISTPEKEGKTYDLSLDDSEDTSIEALEKELGVSLKPEAVEPATTPNVTAPQMPSLSLDDSSEQPTTEEKKEEPAASGSFSLEIQPAPESLALIDSTKTENDLDESGEWGLEALSSSLKNDPSKPAVSDADKPLFELDSLSSETTEAGKAAPPPTAATTDLDSKPLFDLAAGNAPSEEKPQPAAQAPLEPPKDANLGIELEASPATEKAPSPPTTEVKPQVAAPPSNVEEKVKEEKPKETPAPEKQNAAHSQETFQEAKVITSSQVKKKEKAANNVKKKPSFLSVPLDILIPVFVGGLLLGAVNWFYFTSKQGDPQEAMMQSQKINEIIKSDNTPNEPTAAPEVKRDFINYVGENVADTSSIKGAIATDFEVVKSISIEITTPQPPPLTPEEIVQNLPERIWLKRIEIESLNFQSGTDGQLTGKGQAKVYIEQGFNRNRIVGEVVATLTPKDDRKAAEINVRVASLPGTESVPHSTFLVDKNPLDGKFRVLLERSLLLAIKLDS